jgi:hypothetical protein
MKKVFVLFIFVFLFSCNSEKVFSQEGNPTLIIITDWESFEKFFMDTVNYEPHIQGGNIIRLDSFEILGLVSEKIAPGKEHENVSFKKPDLWLTKTKGVQGYGEFYQITKLFSLKRMIEIGEDRRELNTSYYKQCNLYSDVEIYLNNQLSAVWEKAPIQVQLKRDANKDFAFVNKIKLYASKR